MLMCVTVCVYMLVTGLGTGWFFECICMHLHPYTCIYECQTSAGTGLLLSVGHACPLPLLTASSRPSQTGLLEAAGIRG